MKIKKLNNYYNDENTYLVYDETTKNGVVIDPGYKAEGILVSAADDGVQIKYILLTHCHYDHISDVEELTEQTGAKLVTGIQGKINIADPDVNLTYGGLGREISLKGDQVLSDGEALCLDSLQFTCIETPGHTNCSVCYLCGNHLFSGDTLFRQNVGRWDLPTGSEASLVSSIQQRLYTLEEDIQVHPGHGEETTIGYEKKFNLYVKG